MVVFPLPERWWQWIPGVCWPSRWQNQGGPWLRNDIRCCPLLCTCVCMGSTHTWMFMCMYSLVCKHTHTLTSSLPCWNHWTVYFLLSGTGNRCVSIGWNRDHHFEGVICIRWCHSEAIGTHQDAEPLPLRVDEFSCFAPQIKHQHP